MSSSQCSHHIHAESSTCVRDDESSLQCPARTLALSDDASEHHCSNCRREDSRPPQHSVKSELTPMPDFRDLRQSPELPRQPSSISTSIQSTISASYNTRNINSNRQDVPPVVNSSVPYLSSPVTPTDALAHYLGPSVPTTPLNHVLTLRRQRPRTSNQVFTAPHGNIAPNGIPQSLPPAPSTAPRRIQPAESTFADFAALSQNYLKMLNQKPTDITMDANTTMTAETVFANPAFGPELQNILNVMKASSMPPPPTPQTPELLLSSPAFSDINDFFSPDAEYLNTPLFEDRNDDMLTGMTDFEDGALFPPMEEYSGTTAKDPPQSGTPDLLDSLITMTPESPFIHDFNTVDPSSLFCPPLIPAHTSPLPSSAPISESNAVAPPSVPVPGPDSVPPSRKRSTATGTRKGVTPGALVDVDAPTQPRKYVLPSATSRKELPSGFAKKRSRSTAFGEDEEFNEVPPGPDASEREQIEFKRRQNTVAARRSRKRKLEYQQNLETSVERLTRERDIWKTRATMLLEMLQSRGVAFSFSDSMDED